jgi:hypothetical protein
MHSKIPGCCLMVAAASTILFIIKWRYVNQVFHVRNFLAASRTVTDSVRRLEWRQPAQPVCMSIVAHTSCGTPVRTVVKSNQHGAIHLVQNRRHSLGAQCSVWQRTGRVADLSRAFFEQWVSRLSYVCFRRPSPMGNWYVCSEQAKQGARTISSHAAI